MEPNVANGILLEGKISAILDQVTWELQDPPFEAWQAGAPHNAIRAIRSQDSAMGDTSNLGFFNLKSRGDWWNYGNPNSQKWDCYHDGPKMEICLLTSYSFGIIWNLKYLANWQTELEVPLAIMPFPPCHLFQVTWLDHLPGSCWKLRQWRPQVLMDKFLGNQVM